VSEAAPPTMNGVHHVIINVSDLLRSRAFYASLIPRLGYGTTWEPQGGTAISLVGAGGSFWIKQQGDRFATDTFSKDRVGLSEIAFRAESREQVDALARDVSGFGGMILDPLATTRNMPPDTMRYFSQTRMD
jgi:catechol 2,3-dioxygenase-like lactoylglutathione lyase family enzyme